MKLGIPAGVDTPLGKRLVALTFLRLIVLAALLVIIELYYFREMPFGGFSTVVAIATVAAAFLLSATYTVLLRRGQQLKLIAYAQLLTDQLTWTAIVYLSGGVTSGSSSLYGLTCVSGAILLGTGGAAWSALVGVTSYLTLCAGFAYGFVHPPADQFSGFYVTDSQLMVYPAFATVLATALVSVLAAYLAERLRAFGGRLEAVTKRAEHAERLAALGRLAAGLAHEIRNPLGSIRGSIELLRTGGELAEEDTRLCSIIEREAARLNDLVTDMVDLSSPRLPEKIDMDLASTAQNVVQLAVRSAAGADIEVRYCGPDALIVRADAAQLRQVLWNLVRNGMQASKEGTDVTVTLESNDSGDVVMSVRDQGSGIPESKREHIYDAFFTTRSHGVGIGLAVVKQVVDAHEFQIAVDSTSQGTTFSVTIPASDVVDEVAPPSSKPLGALALLLVSLVACGGQDWVRSGHSERPNDAIWWDNDLPAAASSGASAPGSTGPGPPASAPSAMSIELTGQPGAVLEFRNTYYDFPHEPTTPETGPTRQLFNQLCQPIRTVSQQFHDDLCVQGSGRLATGETVSFAKRDRECAAICPRTSQKICFDLLDRTKFPYGRGASGKAITPRRSVAIDPEVIPMGSVMYIPEYHGLRGPDGKTHDGCFIAEDRGLKVRGKHVDIFTGHPSTTVSWNKAVPSNVGVRVIVGASRCAYLNKR